MEHVHGIWKNVMGRVLYIIYVYVYIYIIHVNIIHQNRTSDPIYMILIFISHVPCKHGWAFPARLPPLSSRGGNPPGPSPWSLPFPMRRPRRLKGRGSNDGFRRRKWWTNGVISGDELRSEMFFKNDSQWSIMNRESPYANAHQLSNRGYWGDRSWPANIKL